MEKSPIDIAYDELVALVKTMINKAMRNMSNATVPISMLDEMETVVNKIKDGTTSSRPENQPNVDEWLTGITSAAESLKDPTTPRIVIDSFVTKEDIAETAARKLAADHGYIYHDGKTGRPDNWDRCYILRRGGMEDTTEASSEPWYWAEQELSSHFDIIGYRTDPPQPSERMSLQGLWSWYSGSGFTVEFSHVENGKTQWLVSWGHTCVVMENLTMILITLRNITLECDKDADRIRARLLEMAQR